MPKNQLLALITWVGLAFAPVVAAQPPSTPPPDRPGFYGGVELRSGGVELRGVDFGPVASTWGRYTEPVPTDVAGQRSLLFGGYRFANAMALEGSFSTTDRNRLALGDSPVSGRGVGLSIPGATAAPARSWNADVYTAWSFLHRFSLYGRLGYVQPDTAPSYALALVPADPPRRDGVNYGVGLRYDVTSALGLRLEYARFPHFVGEGSTGPLPESDQVQLGVQFRF